jgi:hypothetical protein
LRSGCIVDLRVTDRHVAKGFEHFQVRTGDVLIADAIYGPWPRSLPGAPTTGFLFGAPECVRSHPYNLAQQAHLRL